MIFVIITSSLSGIIEMDGFKSTFSQLYSNDQLSSPLDNNTSFQVCSSGNGASSDLLIVRFNLD